MLYTLIDLLKNQAVLNPTKIALIDGQDRISYQDLNRSVEAFAAYLRDHGIQRGDRVAIFLPRSIKSVVALFSAWFAGGVAVIINDVLKKKQVDYILEHAEVSLLISNNQLLSSIGNSPISSDRIIRIDENTPTENHYSSSVVIGTDLALLIYTSGSTGLPKGIMLSHSNLLSGAFIVSDYLEISEQDILISLLPFSFDYGLNQLLTSILKGGTLVIERSVLPTDICNTLTRERVTGMAGVPMLWQQLANTRSPFTKTKLPHLRYITNSGGRMPENLTKMFRQAHPHVNIFLMFGLTEAFRSTYLPPDQVDKRPTSIGKAIPNVEIIVINANGEICKTGEVGELVHRGGTVSLGYWRDPESTALRFHPAPMQKEKGGIQEIAVYSGDYVKMDEEGYLYYVGRKDQMIKSHGMRVSPEEIEEMIFSSGLVTHVVSFAVPLNDVENKIVAAIVPRNKETYSEELLTNYCGKEMPEYMRPADFWILEHLPQTSSGKPDRMKIKDMYLERKKIQ